jgi:hypothetical protein
LRETLRVNPWWLLLVPTSLGLMAGLLAATAWLEQRMLAPHRIILASVRSRRAPVEHIEAFVAREAERMLREGGDGALLLRSVDSEVDVLIEKARHTGDLD